MKQRDGLKPVIRLASGKDIDSEGRLTQEFAEKFSKGKIVELKLDMRVIDVEIQFGGNKAIIFFSAPGRVDFRELVKELASGLKTRVELKQVGARDEAKLAGGLGICGREFCCSSFLREFVPVSIKMAKNQNLALNPSKVSGGCGRLLCCLTYEDDIYTKLRRELLRKGTRVQTEHEEFGDVLRGDVLNQRMLVELESGEQKWFALEKLTVVDAKAGVDGDDWAEDLDLENLMEPGSDNQASSKVAEDDRSKGSDRNSKGRGRDKGPRGAPKSQASGSDQSDRSSRGGGDGPKKKTVEIKAPST